MKHNDVVLEVKRGLTFHSPQKKAVPRQLPVSRWQTHSWTKKINKLGCARKKAIKLNPSAEDSNRLHHYVCFAHKRNDAQRRRSNRALVLLGPTRFARVAQT